MKISKSLKAFICTWISFFLWIIGTICVFKYINYDIGVLAVHISIYGAIIASMITAIVMGNTND